MSDDLDPSQSQDSGGMTIKCENCGKGRGELSTALMRCAACKSVAYCSKECQRAAWKSHKPRCKNNQEHAQSLKDADAMFIPRILQVPDGISLSEYDARLEDWVRVWQMTLCQAAIHGLRVPDDLNRCKTHLLHVTLRGRPRTEHKGQPKLFFEAVSAVPRTVEDAQTRPGAWSEGLSQMAEQRRQVEAATKMQVILIVVEAPPLGAQFVPIGSIPSSVKRTKINPKWEEDLKSRIASGRFVTGRPF